jgi:predicted ATPase
MRAEHVAAADVAQQCLTLAEHHQHPGLSALGNRFMGQTLSFRGRFTDAHLHLERTLSICAAHPDTIAGYRKFGTDDQVMASSFLAFTLLLLGYPQQSAAAIGKAVSRAHAMGLPFATALVLNQAALLGVLGGGEAQSAAMHAQEAVSVSVEHGLVVPEQRARFIQGALFAQGGEPQRGIELMRGTTAADASHSARNRHTLYLGHLASAHANLGEPEVSLHLLAEAIQTAETTEERFFAAELHRLRGKVLLTLGRSKDAETELWRALTVAQRQGARWWELRTATTLAKHWQQQKRASEAYFLLDPVYRWFAEGFDTQDLQDAKALLDALRPDSESKARVARGGAD